MNENTEGLQFLKITHDELQKTQVYYIFYKYVVNNYWTYPIYGEFKNLDGNNAVYTNVKQECGNFNIDISEYLNGSDIVYNYTDYEFYINLKAEKTYQINKIKEHISLKQEIILYKSRDKIAV